MYKILSQSGSFWLIFNFFIDFVMRIFIEKSKGIDFYQHKHRVNAKGFTQTERYELRCKGIALNGTSSLP